MGEERELSQQAMPDIDMTVEAVLTLLPTTEKSGRRTPALSGYRPNHNFYGSGNGDMCMGVFRIPDEKGIAPGCSSLVQVHFAFLRPQDAVLVKEGFEWLVQEGGRVIGSARVVRVVSVGPWERP